MGRMIIFLAFCLSCSAEQGFGENKDTPNDEGGSGELLVEPSEVTFDFWLMDTPNTEGLRITNVSDDFPVEVNEVRIINAGETLDINGIATSAFTDLRPALDEHTPPFSLDAGTFAEFLVTGAMLSPGTTEGAVRIKSSDFSDNPRGEFTVVLKATGHDNSGGDDTGEGEDTGGGDDTGSGDDTASGEDTATVEDSGDISCSEDTG